MAAIMENNAAQNQEVSVNSGWDSWIPTSVRSKMTAIDDFWDLVEQLKANFSHGIFKGLEETFQQVAVWVMSWQIWKSATIQGWIRYFITMRQRIKARINYNFELSNGCKVSTVIKCADDLVALFHDFRNHPVTQDWIQFIKGAPKTCKRRLLVNFSKGFFAGIKSTYNDFLSWINDWELWDYPLIRELMYHALILVEKVVQKLEDYWHGFYHHKWMPVMMQTKLDLLKVEPRLRRLGEFVNEQAVRLPEPEQAPAQEAIAEQPPKQASPQQSPPKATSPQQASMDLNTKTNGFGDSSETASRKNRRSKNSSKSNTEETATF